MLEWVEDLNSRFFEIRVVSGDDDQFVYEGRSRNQTVFYRHGPAGRAKSCEQLRPAKPCFNFPRQTNDVRNGVEPFVEVSSPFPARQTKDSEANFAKDDGIDGNLSLVEPQPVDHTFVSF
jgi:hypothetical protein